MPQPLLSAQFGATKNTSACALMYIALGRQSLLAGLYRTYGDARVASFLSRDFSLDKNQLAAEKNAYVLLGQHRYEMAAAWFILAGNIIYIVIVVYKHKY